MKQSQKVFQFPTEEIADQTSESITAYAQAFPHVQLTIFQKELILMTVEDIRAWRNALIFWAGNDYRPQSVFKILDYYKQIKEGTTGHDRTKYRDTVGKNYDD